MSSPSAISHIKPALDTPPSSDIEPSARLPPSPPLSPKGRTPKSNTVVNQLIRSLRLRRRGVRSKETGLKLDPSDWQSFTLSQSDYTEFERRVKADRDLRGFYEDKIRYDWEGDREIYILRMPSATHEFFVSSVSSAVRSKIDELVETLKSRGCEGDHEVTGELKLLEGGGSTTLELHIPQLVNSSQESAATEESVIKRSPDWSLYHPSQPHLPGVVFEVSYSQQRKDLPRLAESYIVDSSHAIRCVVGLDIPYPHGSKSKSTDDHVDNTTQLATVSVWRPGVEKGEDGEDIGICRCDVDALPFRNASGIACCGYLELTLADLLPPSAIPSDFACADKEGLIITFADLTSFLTKATIAETSAESFTSTASSNPAAPARFRKRKRTPPEELSDDREADYERQEEKELHKDHLIDGEWQSARRRSKRVKEGLCGEGDSATAERVDTLPERRRSSRRRKSGRAVGEAS